MTARGFVKIDASEPPPLEAFGDYVARVKADRDRYLRPGMMVTTYAGPITRTRWFEDSSTDELRRMLRPIGADVGRAQLLALAANRWPCGWWVEIEADSKYFTLERSDGLELLELARWQEDGGAC